MGFNKIYSVIGKRSGGKTPFILGGKYEEGLASIYMKKGMSVLIVDEVDHPKYRHVPTLHPDNYHILSERVGMYRTLCTIDNFPLLFPQLLKVWNTLIVFEDCYKYIPIRLTKKQMAILGNSKNQNNCLVFMHWCWGLCQKDIIRLTNFFAVFPTSDGPECRKNDLKGCIDVLMKAHQLVCKGREGQKPYVMVDSGN